jgi:DNA polymerase III subunit delta'
MSLPPEPRANPELVGHDHAAEALAEAALSGRLHHAWLIAGLPGLGKATLAYRFARWLLAGMPPAVPGQAPLYLAPADPLFRRVSAGAHADLFTLEPNTGERGKKEVLRAEDARAAVRFLSLTSAEGGWRCVVIDEAERADNVAVPNILLKTLEEPPPRTVLLMTSSAPERLLPTIRSRCRRLDLHPLGDQALAGLLARWLPDLPEADLTTLTRIADGAPGRALTLAEGAGLELQGLVETVLKALPRLDPRQAVSVADKVAGRRDAVALTTFFELLRRALRAAVRQAARGGAQGFVTARSLAEWSVLWDRLGRLADETERLNLDRKQAVLTGLSWLAAR